MSKKINFIFSLLVFSNCVQRPAVIVEEHFEYLGSHDLSMERYTSEDFFKKEITFQVSTSYGPGRYDQNYEEKGEDYPISHVRWTEQRNFRAVLQLMSEGKISVKYKFRFNLCC